jgi:hypothetical protein
MTEGEGATDSIRRRDSYIQLDQPMGLHANIDNSPLQPVFLHPDQSDRITGKHGTNRQDTNMERSEQQ